MNERTYEHVKYVKRTADVLNGCNSSEVASACLCARGAYLLLLLLFHKPDVICQYIVIVWLCILMRVCDLWAYIIITVTCHLVFLRYQNSSHDLLVCECSFIFMFLFYFFISLHLSTPRHTHPTSIIIIFFLIMKNKNSTLLDREEYSRNKCVPSESQLLKYIIII